MEISNLPNKVFKVMIIKMLTRLRRRIAEHCEIFNKELENIRKFQTSYRAEEFNNQTEKYTR